MRRKAAVIVPASNEETVIENTIRSLLLVFRPEDIYVVSDGSSDRTVEIARKIIPNVLALPKNHGKASAMNYLIEEKQLPEKYQYIMTIDADTEINRHYLQEALKVFKGDKSHKIACVAGKVQGKKYNWLTYYRLWEYEVFQQVHKSAQSVINAITVCPGCGTIYRSSVFNKLKIPSETITEDMDLTIQIHRQKLGKIAFCPKAIVYTQDPKNLHDYLKQIERWYTGFWQCLAKNEIPWGGQRIDAELALLALEGLFSSLVYFTLIVFAPFAFFKAPLFFIFPFIIDLFVLIPTLSVTAKRCHANKIFLYLPHFYFLRFLANVIYLKSYLKVTFGFDHKMKWLKINRYKVLQEKLWVNPAYQ